MIRLGLTRNSKWFDLGSGVRVLARPVTTAIYRSAIATSQRQIIEIAKDKGLIESAGGRISGIPNMLDRDEMEGLRQQLLLQALAIHAIQQWEGIGGDDGAAADASPENIAIFIRDFPLHAARFEEQYLSEIAAIVEEGEGSGTGPSGTSEAVPDTAQGAETKNLAA